MHGPDAEPFGLAVLFLTLLVAPLVIAYVAYKGRLVKEAARRKLAAVGGPDPLDAYIALSLATREAFAETSTRLEQVRSAFHAGLGGR